MNGSSWSDFIAMGGYGLYVWGSLGMCCAVLTAELVLLKRRRQNLRAEASDLAALETGENAP